MARSLVDQPALSVAYPKYFRPSVVSGRSVPPAMSRIHRFQSRTNAPRLPSGDTFSGFLSEDMGAVRSGGIVLGQSGIAAVQAMRVFRTGSTRSTGEAPSGRAARYQNRSSGSQFAAALPPTTSPLTAGGRNVSARA